MLNNRNFASAIWVSGLQGFSVRFSRLSDWILPGAGLDTASVVSEDPFNSLLVTIAVTAIW